jgi:DNA polymerase-4
MAISTVGDLAAHDPSALSRRLGPALGAHLVALANGQDPREVETTRDAKSISVEETFPVDLRDTAAVEGALLRLCTRLADRLHHAGLVGRTLTLKVRFGDFTTVTRSTTAAAALAHATDLWDVARVLLERAVPAGTALRLLGVAVGRLEPPPAEQQLPLGGDRRGKAADIAQEVRARFGSDALMPARLVRKRSTEGEDSPNL